MPTDLTERNQQILISRVCGETLDAIGKRHGLAHQNVHAIFVRESRRAIDALELRLMANRKTGDVELFLIPDHGGEEFDTAIEYFRWAIRQLAERGVRTRVHYRPVETGVVFGVEEVDNREEASA